MHMQGACAIIKMGALKFSNGLMRIPDNLNLRKLTAPHFQMPDNLNLRKLTASHFQVGVQITQNANENMPNIFLIVYLNENLRYCNENLAWGK